MKSPPPPFLPTRLQPQLLRGLLIKTRSNLRLIRFHLLWISCIWWAPSFSQVIRPSLCLWKLQKDSLCWSVSLLTIQINSFLFNDSQPFLLKCYMLYIREKVLYFFNLKKWKKKCNFIIFRLIHNWIVIDCYWPVEIPNKETNESKSFGFREKIAWQFKNTKHVNTVFQIQLFFSHLLCMYKDRQTVCRLNQILVVVVAAREN